MAQQLEIVWSLLSEVSDRCADLTWKSLEGKVSPPEDWSEGAARLEYRAFGIFLLSHALLHRRHASDAWNAVMDLCVAEVEDEFVDIDIEGDDFEAFIGARVDAYGEWSQEVRRTGRQNEEAQGWVRILKNYLLACSSDESLLLKPPITIVDFLLGRMLEVHLSSCLAHIYNPMFYGPVAYLCEQHRNILDLSPQQVDQLLARGLRESRDEPPPKRSGLMGRLFGQR